MIKLAVVLFGIMGLSGISVSFGAPGYFKADEFDSIEIIGSFADVAIQGETSSSLVWEIQGSEASLWSIDIADRKLVFKQNLKKEEGYSPKENDTSQTWPRGLAAVSEDSSSGRVSRSNRPFLRIKSPHKPLFVSLLQGHSDILNWGGETKVVLLQGDGSLQKGTGSLHVNLHKGKWLLEDFKGASEFDIFQGQLKIKSNQGLIDLYLMQADLDLKSSKGSLKLHNNSGKVGIENFLGEIQFENLSGSLKLESVQGSIQGQTQDGTVTLGALSDTQVQLQSKSGRVNLKNQGPSHLNLTTLHGEIFVPEGIAVVDYGKNGRMVRTKTEGAGEEPSQFKVQSESGIITFKN